MEHIAIDLGAKASQLCVRSETGEIVEERRIATRPLGGSAVLSAQKRVILESIRRKLKKVLKVEDRGEKTRG